MDKMVGLLIGSVIGTLFLWFVILPALGVVLAICGIGMYMILFAH